MPNTKYKFETLQLHVGQETPDPATDARAVPIYATTSYVFQDSAQAAGRFALSEGGNIYTRLMNPTSDVFEKRIAALERGRCAVHSHRVGRHYICCPKYCQSRRSYCLVKTVYGGTYNLFSHTLADFGIETTFVDGKDPTNFEKGAQRKYKGRFLIARQPKLRYPGFGRSGKDSPRARHTGDC